MNKYLFILAIVMAFSCSSDDSSTNNNQPPPATTAISDSNFEQALIDLGFDDTIDGSVLTASLALITDLIIDNKNIASLNGLQDFINLSNLSANGNVLTSVDVSANTKLKFIFLDDNNLSAINVQGLLELEKVSVSNNGISAININGISTLQQMMIDGNGISQLDVSTNSSLNILDTRDTDISCITVSINQLNNIPNGWMVDNTTSYSTDCN